MSQEPSTKIYDLEERTAKFGENIITFLRQIKENTINRPLINQLVKSATSVGANYMEANGASSKKDFCNKIYICKKESQETKHWLRMLMAATDETSDRVNGLLDESQQLSMIFHKIVSSSRNKI